MIGPDWDGRLEEWIGAVIANQARKKGEEVWDISFPTDALRDEYLGLIATRPELEVMSLLRAFLFENAKFGSDTNLLSTFAADPGRLEGFAHYEFIRRLMAMGRRGGKPHVGVRWVLDLLPDHPRLAAEVIEAYDLAHVMFLPDGRSHGLEDAAALIRAYWIRNFNAVDGREVLNNLSPRDFEQLICVLYERMGYEAILTPPQRDGGRDVIATISDPGRAQHLLIECKLYTGPVGVEIVRALSGVVSVERASGGVIITPSRFTRGATLFVVSEKRIELIDGQKLLGLLQEFLGPKWSMRLDSLLIRSRIGQASRSADS